MVKGNRKYMVIISYRFTDYPWQISEITLYLKTSL